MSCVIVWYTSNSMQRASSCSSYSLLSFLSRLTGVTWKKKSILGSQLKTMTTYVLVFGHYSFMHHIRVSFLSLSHSLVQISIFLVSVVMNVSADVREQYLIILLMEWNYYSRRLVCISKRFESGFLQIHQPPFAERVPGLI